MDAADLNAVREAGARVAGRTDIADVRLLRSSVDLERMPEAGERLSWDLNIAPAFEYQPGATGFVVHCDFQILIQEVVADGVGGKEEAPESPIIATIAFRYSALFEIHLEDHEAPFSSAELEAFSNSTAVFSLYPYAREFIHDSTSRAGLPPLVLNFFKISIPQPSK